MMATEKLKVISKVFLVEWVRLKIYRSFIKDFKLKSPVIDRPLRSFLSDELNLARIFRGLNIEITKKDMGLYESSVKYPCKKSKVQSPKRQDKLKNKLKV